MMDVAGIVSVFMQLDYHNMILNTLLYKVLFRNDEGIILTKKCRSISMMLVLILSKKTFSKQCLL